MEQNKQLRKPEWLKKKISSDGHFFKNSLQRSGINTVCESARCPNICQCFKENTATFMILGDTCTRNCKFCNVKTGKPDFYNFEEEIKKILNICSEYKYDYVTITSVTRDDLDDFGISSFVKLTEGLHKKNIMAELLIPDLNGNITLLQNIIEVQPEVLNHNIEMIQRLYSKIRPQSDFDRSLNLLKNIKKNTDNKKTIAKTGFMIGLGETTDEIKELIKTLASINIDVLTIGQYLRPSLAHFPVEKYRHPDEFSFFEEYSLSNGFKAVIAEPYARSSYKAKEMYFKAV